ncbi:4Fe-4S dicluster domain-containing protein [Klebsiella pneumoniae]|uniref:4Fe-4S dicluster domain-containing protein n=1 Tax=Klebsiella pneumoniae TaxID=573 RepID=UPI003EE2E809
MSTQYGFFIDSARCTGCKTCELACKDYKNLTPEVSFRRIYEYAGGDWQEDNGVWQQNVFAYYLSIACNHCEDPACTKVCPSGAMHKREDGWVAPLPSAHFTRPSIVIKPNANARPCGDTTGYLANPKEV